MSPSLNNLPYRPGREIARGGMGAILDTQDEKFQRAVAMKVMLRGANEEGRRRFLQEARVLGQLAHPNIVPVHDLGVDEQGRLFYTMKLVKGVTLRAVLDGLKAGDRDSIAKYPLGQLLTVFQKVCDAMAFAHARGVIHRDLKPDNIMVGEFGEVLVMDWGLAKILPDSSSATALLDAEPAGLLPSTASLPGNVPGPAASPAPTGPALDIATIDSHAETLAAGETLGTSGATAARPTPIIVLNPSGKNAATSQPDLSASASAASSVTLEGAVMGTPHFMAPEQARGAVNDLDARSDVFALGGVLYMILALERPVAGKEVTEVLGNILAGRITPPALRQTAPLPHCLGGRVPEALSAVAMKALQVDPARRYQSVAYLQSDLAAYQSGFATSAEEAGVFKQLQLLILRHKILAAASVLALLLTAGFMAKVMASERRAVFNQQRAATKEAEAIASRKNTAATLVRLRDTAPTFHEQALARLKDQQLEPALEKVAYAIELMPAEPKFRLLQADLLQTLFRMDEAKVAYTAALQLDPTNAVARENLALCGQFSAGTNGSGWNAKSLTNMLASLRRQQRLDEAIYLTSKSGVGQAGDKQLLQTWQARLTAAGLKTAKLSIQDSETLYLQITGPTDKELAMLKGMPLKKLILNGGSAIRSLTPLTGMPLQELWLERADMDSLEPLRGMRLGKLTIRDSRVSDLRPLAGMPLTNLVINGCKNVEDLSPLKGLPLQWLVLGGAIVQDLTPLKGMPLVDLILRCNTLTNLAPLAGMPLRTLEVNVTRVVDLKPLAGLPLRRLTLGNGKIVTHDLSPLRDCRQLEDLLVEITAKDWNVLLDIPSLKTVRQAYSAKPLPPAQFIAEQTRPAKK